MEALCSEKVEKFMRHVQYMVSQMKSTRELVIHQRISLSYYMEKAEELLVLREQLADAERQLESVRMRAMIHYAAIYDHWHKDARLLNTLMNRVEADGSRL